MNTYQVSTIDFSTLSTLSEQRSHAEIQSLTAASCYDCQSYLFESNHILFSITVLIGQLSSKWPGSSRPFLLHPVLHRKAH